MGRTRGIRVNYAQAEGEDDATEQATTPPPAKKPRRSRKRVDDEDDAFEGEASAKASKAKAPRRKGRRSSGRLESLMNMPVDIFTEVCLYLLPIDLLHLARTSRRLREILMSKDAKPMWRESRKLLDGLPDCPTDLSEPQYTSLMFETGCQRCDALTRKTEYIFRMRLCPNCIQSELYTASDVFFMWRNMPEALLESLPSVQGAGFRKTSDDVQWTYKASFIDWVIDCCIDDDGTEKIVTQEFVNEIGVITDMLIETGSAMAEWKEAEALNRQEEVLSISNRRFDSIRLKLLEHGWQDGDFPDIENAEWKALTFRPVELTEQIWRRIYPKLEPMLTEVRELRLEEERDDRMRQRLRDVLGRSADITTQMQTVEPTMRAGLGMSPHQLLSIPTVDAILEMDVPEVTQEMWDSVKDDVLAGHQASFTTMKEFFTARCGPIVATGPPVLFQATTVFECQVCDEQLWFPDVADHDHFCDHDNYGSSGFWNDRVRTSILVERRTARRLIQEMGLDPDTTTFVQAQEILGKNCVCTRCDERVAEVMDFATLVRHYATETKIEFPGNPLRHRNVASVQMHDPAFTDSLVKVLRTDEERAAHTQIRNDFIAYDEEFSAGFPPDWLSVFNTGMENMPPPRKRQCILCPNEFARDRRLSPGEMEIHLAVVHLKRDPDVRRYSY